VQKEIKFNSKYGDGGFVKEGKANDRDYNCLLVDQSTNDAKILAHIFYNHQNKNNSNNNDILEDNKKI